MSSDEMSKMFRFIKKISPIGTTFLNAMKRWTFQGNSELHLTVFSKNKKNNKKKNNKSIKLCRHDVRSLDNMFVDIS